MALLARWDTAKAKRQHHLLRAGTEISAWTALTGVAILFRTPLAASAHLATGAVHAVQGVTFDCGGLNVKAGAGSMIEMMKFDMGGSGATLGAARTLAALQPPGVEVP